MKTVEIGQGLNLQDPFKPDTKIAMQFDWKFENEISPFKEIKKHVRVLPQSDKYIVSAKDQL